MTSNDDLLGSVAKPFTTPRNLFCDTCFYDVKALSPEEMTEFSMTPDQEGAVIVVSPGNAHKKIRHYKNATQMLKMEGHSIRGVAIAGIGSSVVGTAALARNVADTYNFDVAGIVSGYGLTDFITEVMGGWFLYGYVDRIRRSSEVLIEKATRFVAGAATAATANGDATRDRRDPALPRQLDSGTLLDVLSAHPKNLKILVGHSKGAMLIDYVLGSFVRRMKNGAHPFYDDLQVVTVGAVVHIPKEFKKTSQLIGNLDWFGGINSPPELLWDNDPATKPRYIENAWHHLNRDIPYKLGLVDALATHVPL